MTDTVPAVLAAIVAVNKAIAEAGIAKGDRNLQQGFDFRGVDRVYDAVAGPMAEHALISVPKVVSCERAERLSSNNKPLFVVYLEVEYTFWCATDGSSVTVGPVAAEAMDSGDKATSKAMSVAHRTALLQLSTAPVNPVEPDAYTYETERESEEVLAVYDENRERVKQRLQKLDPDNHAAAITWCKTGFEAGRLPPMNMLTDTAAATILNYIETLDLERPFTEPEPVEVSGGLL